MKRRDFLGHTAAAVPVVGSCGTKKEADDARGNRLNVVLIMTDDQGYGDIGCHGNTLIKTPNLDAFYADSVRMKRFFVSPTCSPTRASLLTGRHEFRCGISHTIMGRSLIREDEVTIADVLSEAGYKTGMFGKWHLGDNHPCRPMDKGFGECFYHGGGGITQTPDYWGNTYFSPTVNHNGEFVKTDGYCTDVFFDAAMRWIETHGNRPFFAYITPNAAHDPLQVAESYSKPYEDMGLDQVSSKFYGMITNIDENFGRFTSFLREKGLENNTLVIFMTDNGSSQACGHHLFNDRMRGCKGTPHEGGVRVPCFFRLPGRFEGGRDIGTVAGQVDMLPTLAELCGGKLPENRTLDGASILPLLDGKTDERRDPMYFAHVGRWPADAAPEDFKYKNCSVRDSRFRFVNDSELYDMNADPGETGNVIERFPDDVRRLRDAYDAWWNGILPRVSEPQRISLGAPEEPKSRLCCMDWGPSSVTPGEPDMRVYFWVQDFIAAIVRGDKEYQGRPVKQGTMGAWRTNVVRDGRYAVTLRLVPAEAPADLGILKAGDACVRCGGEIHKSPIEAGAAFVRFDLPLTKGPLDLECWFTGQRADGEPNGAYYADVEYLG